MKEAALASITLIRKEADSITCFQSLANIIDKEWNAVEITFAEPWTIPWVVPPGERDDYEIHFMDKGKGAFYVGGSEYSFNRGDTILLHSMEGNSFSPAADSFRIVFVTFKIINPSQPDLIRQLNRILKNGPFPFSIGEADEIRRIFYSMYREISLRSKGYIFKLKLLLGELVLRIMECVKTKFRTTNTAVTIKTGTKELIDKVIIFLQENYRLDIRLDDMAKLVNLHPRYVCALFSQVTGQTMVEFLKKLRIEKAKRLLLYTPLSITEIAMDAGFNSSQYFSRVFNQLEGISPRNFRKTRTSP